MNFSTQTHDFAPGFGEPVNDAGDMLFWTTQIPDSAVQINFAAGRAEMHVRDLATRDYFTYPNASIPGDFVEATISFDVVWEAPISRRYHVTDAANGFTGSFLENQATVNWSASNSLGFTFVADPGDFSTSVPEFGPIALLGRERNGTYFPGGLTLREVTGNKDLPEGVRGSNSPPRAIGGGKSEVSIVQPPPVARLAASSPLPQSDPRANDALVRDDAFAELGALPILK